MLPGFEAEVAAAEAAEATTMIAKEGKGDDKWTAVDCIEGEGHFEETKGDAEEAIKDDLEGALDEEAKELLETAFADWKPEASE